MSGDQVQMRGVHGRWARTGTGLISFAAP
jgi:hypothetical protein